MRQYVYDGAQLVAELDGTGAVVNRFVYATRPNVPDLILRESGGLTTTYKVASDQLGSPRLIYDISTGAVAQRLEYDEFGRVLVDTNPGFQPFGFAGGLYDADTGLVHFGVRDYDARTGRWLSRDPALFGGGDTNLYAYVGNDPVNAFDPSGISAIVPTWIEWMWQFRDFLPRKSQIDIGFARAMALWDGGDCEAAEQTLNQLLTSAGAAGIIKLRKGSGSKRIPWSSKVVRDADRALDNGATSVKVASRGQAEELFLRRYQGAGYRNTTGLSPTEAKNLFGSKIGTYHWDIGTKAFPHDMSHLQIHTGREVIRIYFP